VLVQRDLQEMLSSSAYQDVSNTYVINRIQHCFIGILSFGMIMALIIYMKLFNLIKMLLNKTCIEVHISNHLSLHFLF